MLNAQSSKLNAQRSTLYSECSRLNARSSIMFIFLSSRRASFSLLPCFLSFPSFRCPPFVLEDDNDNDEDCSLIHGIRKPWDASGKLNIIWLLLLGHKYFVVDVRR